MADFTDDQYAEQPDGLTRITAAAEKEGSEFRSSTDGHISYYLRRAEYIGPCDAPFGTVHVARLFYIRSAPKGSKSPARGHTFILFLDVTLPSVATGPSITRSGNSVSAGANSYSTTKSYSISPILQRAATSQRTELFSQRRNGNDRNG